VTSKNDRFIYRGSWSLCVAAVVIVVLYLINGGYTIETFGFYGIMFAMGARNIWDAKRKRLNATPLAPPQS
jgi:hypothetical protein